MTLTDEELAATASDCERFKGTEYEDAFVAVLVRDLQAARVEVERLTREARDVREAIAYVRSHYDESIFPPRPDGPLSEVYDGGSAQMARLTCDNIRREIEERHEESAEDATNRSGEVR